MFLNMHSLPIHYFTDYILYFWARRKTFDDLCMRGISPEEDIEESISHDVNVGGRGRPTGHAAVPHAAPR
jgi:hypothetical protein